MSNVMKNTIVPQYLELLKEPMEFGRLTDFERTKWPMEFRGAEVGQIPLP